MQKRYQVFVSSTFLDLVEERQDAIRSILDLGQIPAGMELFPAADVEQLSYIKKVIDECDYYVLIMGGRYGSLDTEGVSFTEREYDYAVATGKVVLAFVHGDLPGIPVGKSDVAPRLIQGLSEFREKVRAGRLVREWTSRENLEALVVKALARAMNDFPTVGWIRGDAAASEDLLSQLNSLRGENDRLRLEVDELKRANLPSVANLAPLGEGVTLRYTYRYHDRHSASGYDKDGQIETTWKDVFRAVGPSFYSPATRETIGFALSTFAREELDVGVHPKFLSSDIVMVENQLVALGFMKSYTGKATSGGLHSYLIITDAGRGRLTEILAVRKA